MLITFYNYTGVIDPATKMGKFTVREFTTVQAFLSLLRYTNASHGFLMPTS